ncbi:MAG: hypothetical protein CCU26_13525 [Nitrospira sp. UW-LDO-01]|nr:MAG: hypothetical protein CCU26_13525 [Nitrospira sp. UW-LDO-01]
MAVNLRWVFVERAVPLGKYWRSKPLVFSLGPRCQGLCGSTTHTWSERRCATRSGSASFFPRS